VEQSRSKQVFSFLLTVMIFHVVTYFIFGFLASSILKYQVLFEMPIIKEYYKPFGSVSTVFGPMIQILRGLLIGLVLLPFKKLLEDSKNGWVYIWMIFVGVGILGTPAAAPSSIEGIVYSRIPLWFHAIGFPEILLQTLVFSMLVHNKISPHKLIASEKSKAVLRAVSTACISFIGYTVVSIAFALLAKAKISESSADLRVLGQFALPLLASFIVALIPSGRIFWLKHLFLYAVSASALMLYQSLMLGEGNWIYSIAAPVIPVAISAILLKPKP